MSLFKLHNYQIIAGICVLMPPEVGAMYLLKTTYICFALFYSIIQSSIIVVMLNVLKNHKS